MKNHVWLLIFTLLLAGNLAGCQKSEKNSTTDTAARIPLDFLPALYGDYFKLDSEIVGRPYHIYVRFPEGYDETADRRYPVVYLLDGDSLFPILAANHLFLHYDDQIPEAIVVGIAYGSFEPGVNMRSYDFSTAAADGDPEQGGAADFLAFLERELLPRVESSYLADSQQRILFGQSRGGHLVLYSAFAQPDLFRGRIASNPTFLPNKEQFHAAPARTDREDLTLVVTSGSDDHYPQLREDALAWHERWKERGDAPWSIAFSSIPGGTHAASSVDSYRFGMNRIFEREIRAMRQKLAEARSAATH
ncbi:alpha/beta hydrolase [Microbulbifer magnicolonia]|uniref:alpha/beta hydrolase n=1 Tax=Microbulbifer magnicolonia TaxID=3109744 RepID=UPI002B408524|nr:alpha/beta hydrolase-fold protein [Microbulbifer sp. GG15]